jgi:hypothetical protein
MFTNLKPRFTQIEKVIEIRTGKVILEAYSGYPLDQSNLYFVSDGGENLWDAERPAPDAHYIRVKLETDGRRLAAYTTGRHACDIDIESGKLLNQVQFK